MDIILGSGNNRKKFTLATGYPMRKMAKEQPLEYVKIRGNITALARKGGQS